MMLKSLTYQSMSKPCRINGRTSFPMAQATIPSRRRQHWAYSPATVGFGFHWGPLDIHLEQAMICDSLYFKFCSRCWDCHSKMPIWFTSPWNLMYKQLQKSIKICSLKEWTSWLFQFPQVTAYPPFWNHLTKCEATASWLGNQTSRGESALHRANCIGLPPCRLWGHWRPCIW